MDERACKEWYERNGTTHAHCPEQCEHPQPFLSPDGRMLCGRCWFKYGEEVEVVPCGPGVCDD